MMDFFPGVDFCGEEGVLLQFSATNPKFVPASVLRFSEESLQVATARWQLDNGVEIFPRTENLKIDPLFLGRLNVLGFRLVDLSSQRRHCSDGSGRRFLMVRFVFKRGGRGGGTTLGEQLAHEAFGQLIDRVLWRARIYRNPILDAKEPGKTMLSVNFEARKPQVTFAGDPIPNPPEANGYLDFQENGVLSLRDYPLPR